MKIQFTLRSPKNSLTHVTPKKSDVILLLDGGWGRLIWEELLNFKQEGVHIICVLYDLIPIVHASYCDAVKTKEMEEYLSKIIAYADGVMCISQSVMQEFIAYRKQHTQSLSPTLKVDFFHLGVNHYNHQPDDSIRSEIVQLFNKPTFLMVSTLEPRKNHTYLLDVFDQLWEEGGKSQLVFIGRIGWEIKSLMERINAHPLLGKRLFVFHDINDAELFYSYKHATLLIFPSFAEGFGLPIIEALQHGIPVIASDIPVHKEIGRENIMYIDPFKPETLLNYVREIEQHGVAIPFLPTHYQWQTWDESTRLLLNKIVNMVQDKENHQ